VAAEPSAPGYSPDSAVYDCEGVTREEDAADGKKEPEEPVSALPECFSA
jgi:hypothetical protein